MATDYGALDKTEELETLGGKWHLIPSASTEASLDLGNRLATYGMPVEAKEIFDGQPAKVATQPASTLTLELGTRYPGASWRKSKLKENENQFQQRLLVVSRWLVAEPKSSARVASAGRHLGLASC